MVDVPFGLDNRLRINILIRHVHATYKDSFSYEIEMKII